MRDLFRSLMQELNEPIPSSTIIHTLEEAHEFVKEIDIQLLFALHLQWVEQVAESVVMKKN